MATSDPLPPVQAKDIMMYPLDQFDGKMKTRDWASVKKVPSEGDGKSETPWVPAEKFFDALPLALADAPPMPGEEARYAQVLSVIAAAKADPEIRKAVDKAAADANEHLIEPLFQFRNYGRRGYLKVPIWTLPASTPIIRVPMRV